ncbi:MAG: DUF2179 domain-containing protein [Sphingobacteriia bacterium]|mgnify:FL=1|nr:DUF2179 domain-containing protein [Sphingobacteriia bacterium]
MENYFDPTSPVYTYLIVPLLIFLARVSDQSIGTLRIIFVSKGYRYIGPFLGFFEVIIWLIAVRFALEYIDTNILCYVGYGAGFAMGNFVGMVLEEKISLGTVLVRIIPKKDTTELVKYLRENNYGLTIMDAEGSIGPVKIILTIVKRKDAQHIIEIINRFNPNAFYTVEEVKAVNRGIFKRQEADGLLTNIMRGARKAN